MMEVWSIQVSVAAAFRLEGWGYISISSGPSYPKSFASLRDKSSLRKHVEPVEEARP
jgi:hypothetical protein